MAGNRQHYISSTPFGQGWGAYSRTLRGSSARSPIPSRPVAIATAETVQQIATETITDATTPPKTPESTITQTTPTVPTPLATSKTLSKKIRKNAGRRTGPLGPSKKDYSTHDRSVRPIGYKGPIPWSADIDILTGKNKIACPCCYRTKKGPCYGGSSDTACDRCRGYRLRVEECQGKVIRSGFPGHNYRPR